MHNYRVSHVTVLHCCILWCALLCGGQSKSKFALLKTAITTHATWARDAMTGKGVDRHLMGLYILSEMSGITPRPALFSDKAYTKAKTYHLSTSNVSAGAGGFMAMTEEGYGVCYGIHEGIMEVNISSFAVRHCRRIGCRAPSLPSLQHSGLAVRAPAAFDVLLMGEGQEVLVGCVGVQWCCLSDEGVG